MSTVTITDAELELMRILWSQGSLTSRDIINHACALSHWKEGTVKSLLSRLQQKQWVRANTEHKPTHYEPNIQETDYMQQRLQQAITPICQTKYGQYLHNLLEDLPLTQTDCQNLITLLTHRQQTAPEKLMCNCLPEQCNCHHHS